MGKCLFFKGQLFELGQRKWARGSIQKVRTAAQTLTVEANSCRSRLITFSCDAGSCTLLAELVAFPLQPGNVRSLLLVYGPHIQNQMLLLPMSCTSTH